MLPPNVTYPRARLSGNLIAEKERKKETLVSRAVAREKEASFITVADVVRWRWGIVLAARAIATVKSVGRSEGQAEAAGSLYFFSAL